MTASAFRAFMERHGAVDREPPVPKGRIRTWDIEWDGEIYKVVEMRVYDSAVNQLMGAVVLCGVLTLALVAVLVWR